MLKRTALFVSLIMQNIHPVNVWQCMHTEYQSIYDKFDDIVSSYQLHALISYTVCNTVALETCCFLYPVAILRWTGLMWTKQYFAVIVTNNRFYSLTRNNTFKTFCQCMKWYCFPVVLYHTLVSLNLVIVALLQETCSNDDIHASLDSLCISMTEHALAGGFGESLW